jgi:antitoxin component of MazEF toxin-antitoxin module
MKIHKQIFKSGNSFVIYLDKNIMKSYDLKEGDIIELNDMIKIKRLPTKKSNNKILKEIKKEVIK